MITASMRPRKFSGENGKLTKITRGSILNIKREPFFIGAFELSDNGIAVHGRPSLSEYQGCLDFVDRTHKSAGWWLVDLIAYADSREDWRESIDTIIDSDLCSETTAYQYRYIKKHVPQRIDGVPFGHHAVVASLDPKEQITWLERARDEGWTQKELQASLRAEKRTQILSGQAPTMHTVDVTVRLTVEAENSWAAQEAAWGLVKAAVAAVPHAHVIGALALRHGDRPTT